MERANRNPALDRLDALVGEWKLAAGPPGGEPWPGEATASFEWLEGETWLIERWSVDLPEAPDGIAIFGLADAPPSGEEQASGKAFQQHYFDSRGVHRVYEMSLEDGEWQLWREGPPFDQRFTGTLSEDGNTIAGRWEIREADSDWRADLDFKYTRIN